MRRATWAGYLPGSSLHTYGKHINFTGRSQFDPDAGTEEPFVVVID